MLSQVDPRAVTFAVPQYLWLLVGVFVLFGLWVWQVRSRWLDVRRLTAERTVPFHERFSQLGELPFWWCVLLATGLGVVALARPVTTTSLVQTAGVDLIVLQDGSASMRVQDVEGDRWQRSMRFLRVLGESLRWEDDRVAMSVFAHIATPQIRLTKDPNTFFFFLDHLDQPPFRLEDDTTWDTNIELGVYWGLRLVERDEELSGRSPRGQVLVLISDGQAWSGEVEESVQRARARDIPIVVVGVGTPRGGPIPEVVTSDSPATTTWSPIRSMLDRSSLSALATSGRGRYFELDRGGDRDIANAIIAFARRHSGSRGLEQVTADLYWPVIFGGACCLCAAVLFLRARAELWIHLAGAGAALVVGMLITR